MRFREEAVAKRARGHNMILFGRLYRDQAGATAIEYGLIVAMIAIGIITALQGLGPQLGTTFSTVSTTLSAGNAA